jgi:hypothetical protein
MQRSLPAALLLALACAAAQAQPLRTLPAEAKRGEIRHLQEMDVAINGEAMRLAPGAQIRNASNLIVMPAALPAGALVKYVLNAQGQVFRVWILTPEEAAQPDRRP